MATIRHAEPGDASAIADVWNPVIRDTLITFNSVERSADEIAAMIAANRADGHAWLVVTEEGGMIGFASFSQFRKGVGYARTMEHTVILAPQAWGRGIGRRLMDALAEEARTRGMHSLIGGVSAANTPGIEFHARIGFTEVGRLPEVGWKFGRWLDLVLMQKRL
jgi:phosphinothricin acetyltransferase